MSSSFDSVLVWNFTSNKVSATIVNINGNYVNVIKKISSSRFATGDSQGFIRVYDFKTLQIVANLTAHTGMINSLEKLSNGYLASSSNDGCVKVWNTVTFEEITSINPFDGRVVNHVRGLLDGTLIVGGAYDSVTKIDLNNPMEEQPFWSLTINNQCTQIVLSDEDILIATYDKVYMINQTSNYAYLELNTLQQGDEIKSLEKLQGKFTIMYGIK